MDTFVRILFEIGLTLGVGSSTFALIFYIRALEDGIVEDSERRLMHSVYIVMRIGMALLGITLCYALITAPSLQTLTSFVLLLIVAINALLMHLNRMPMRFGPVIAGGSWYMLFFVETTPVLSFGIMGALFVYLLFLCIFYVVFQIVKSVFTVVDGSYGGDVMSDSTTLNRYATDASTFRISPEAVYFPRTVKDIRALIALVRKERRKGIEASLTLRAGGTCMSGGPLNTGFIVDMTKYMNKISIDTCTQTATVEMGAFFRDIEDKAKEVGLMFSAYPSSHRICGIGGMIGNNASGEKSLRCGATSDNVQRLEVVLADGSMHTVEKKDVASVTDAREKALVSLYNEYGARLKDVTDKVKKSASGYRLEKLIEGNQFNAIPLFVGAQGTLGIVTKAVLKLVPIPKYTELLLVSATTLTKIPKILEVAFQHNPEGLETFDIHTWKRACMHMPEYAEKMLPHIDPKSALFVLIQLSEDTEEATKIQAETCREALVNADQHVSYITEKSVVDAVWHIRRHAFLLMRDYNDPDHKAVPCIEDVIVPIASLGVFTKRLTAILKKRVPEYGFHGHIGDGSLRIIPIFDFRSPTVQEDIATLMNEVFALVKELHGNISADHSDGIIRTPYIREFYGEDLYHAFERVKTLYDPEGIMNPNKKVGGSVGLLNQCLDCTVPGV